MAYIGLGSGTENDPYQINSIEELNDVRNNSGTLSVPDVYFKFMRDLDFDDDDSYDNSSNKSTYTTGVGWIPIASFFGVILGNNKKLKNLYCKYDSGNLIGLFGYCNVSIYNLHLEDVDIGFDGSTRGHIGGLCGWNGSDIERVIEECSVTGTIIGRDVIGGLCGLTVCNISKCRTNVNITGRYYLGGLVGYYEYQSRTTSDCYTEGNVIGVRDVGGFLGYAERASGTTGVLTNCYSNCYVEGTETAGGFVATHGLLVPTYTRCFWNVNISSQQDSLGGVGKNTIELKDIDTFSDWDIVVYENFTNETWFLDEGEDYPRLYFEFVDKEILVSDIELMSNTSLFYASDYNNNLPRLFLYNQTIEASVVEGDLVYYNTTSSQWVISSNSTPQGIYAGNNVVVLSGLVVLSNLKFNSDYWMDSAGKLTSSKASAYNGTYIGRSITKKILSVNIDIVGDFGVVEQ